MLSGWSAAIGSALSSCTAARSSRRHGPRHPSATVVAWRNQVERPGQPREAGKRSASMRPFRVEHGGDRQLVEHHEDHRRSASPPWRQRPRLRLSGSTSFDTGEVTRKTNRKTSGSGPSTVRTSGAALRAQRRQGRRPRRVETASGISSALAPPKRSVEDLQRECGGQQADQEDVQGLPGVPEAQEGPPRQGSATVGGTSVTPNARTTMSQLVFPRATKNSGLSARTSNSGLAKARLHRTARWTHATRRERVEFNRASATAGAMQRGAAADPHGARGRPGPRAGRLRLAVLLVLGALSLAFLFWVL